MKTKTKRVPVLDSFSFSLERKFRPNRTTETKTNRSSKDVGWSPCCEIEFPMTLIYNLWNRFKIREVHDLFSFSFRRNVGYDPSEIFSTNRVLRFVFVFVTVRGGVSTKTKTSTRFVFVFVGRLGLALLYSISYVNCSLCFYALNISRRCIITSLLKSP